MCLGDTTQEQDHKFEERLLYCAFSHAAEAQPCHVMCVLPCISQFPLTSYR